MERILLGFLLLKFNFVSTKTKIYLYEKFPEKNSCCGCIVVSTNAHQGFNINRTRTPGYVIIPMSYVSSSNWGSDLPISTRDNPSRGPFNFRSSVDLYYYPSLGKISFSGNGIFFTYTILCNDEILSSGQSCGQGNLTISIPSHDEGTLTIRVEADTSVYEGYF